MIGASTQIAYVEPRHAGWALNYARRTGRTALRLDTPLDIWTHADIEGLVIDLTSVKLEHLESLAAYSIKKRACGILPPPTNEEPELIPDGERCVAELPRRSTGVICVIPAALLPPTLLPESGVVLLDRKTPRERLTSELARGSDALVFLGHSDGVDAQLPDGMVLCPLNNQMAWPGKQPTPNCVRSGQCYRLGLPLEEALVSPRNIRASLIRTQLFINLGCFGIMGSDSLVDPEWGLMTRVWRSGRVSAAICSLGVAMVSPREALNVAGFVAQGRTAGQVLEFLGRSEFTRGGRLDAVLLGDPLTRSFDVA